MAESLGETVTITEQPGYNYLSGTSMAAPYVAGVAGKVWRAVSDCPGAVVLFPVSINTSCAFTHLYWFVHLFPVSKLHK